MERWARWPQRPRGAWLLALAAVAACAPLTAVAFKLRARSSAPSEAAPPAPASLNYRLDVEPAGVDGSGALLLRVHVVPIAGSVK
jgi:hypothetical protein